MVSPDGSARNRRLQLLRVLVERPNVLILDEPTNDLDAATWQSGGFPEAFTTEGMGQAGNHGGW